MTRLQQAAKRAQRRLWLNRWLEALGWSLAAAGTLFVLIVVVERVWPGSSLDEDARRVVSTVAPGLVGLALAGSVVWTALTRDSLAYAAARLDLAAGLKERVSTGLYCENAQDPFARAVVADATRASRGIAVPRHLPVKVPYSANYAGGSLVLALLFFWLFPVIDLAGKQEQLQKEHQQRELVSRTRAAVASVLKQQAAQIGRRNPALKDELDKLEPLPDAPLAKPQDVINEPIKQINQLAKKLEERRSDSGLAKIDEFRKWARRAAASQPPDSLTGQLARALAKGDFESAQEALRAIRAELAKAAQTDQEAKQAQELQRQLQELSAKLKQAAQSDRRNRKDLADAGLSKEEIEKVLRNLKEGKAGDLEKKLAERGLSQEQIDELVKQLKKRCGACSMASKLAQNLGQAAAGADGSGDLSEAAMAGFSASAEQLSQLEALQQELNQLTSDIDDLNRMKNQLCQGCSACGGTGMKDGQPCSACQGTGMGQGRGSPGQMGPGMGQLGQGQGGVAPEQATRFKTVRERTRVNTLPGAIDATRFVHGEQFSGPVSDEFVEAAIAAQREVQDAVAREALPRVYHGSLKRYFDHAITGLPPEKVQAARDKAGQENTDAE